MSNQDQDNEQENPFGNDNEIVPAGESEVVRTQDDLICISPLEISYKKDDEDNAEKILYAISKEYENTYMIEDQAEASKIRVKILLELSKKFSVKPKDEGKATGDENPLSGFLDS